MQQLTCKVTQSAHCRTGSNVTVLNLMNEGSRLIETYRDTGDIKYGIIGDAVTVVLTDQL